MKNGMKYILCLSLALLLCSCRTKSEIYGEKRSLVEARRIESRKDESFSQSVIDSLFKKLSFHLQMTVAKFAPADSCGFQSVESITQANLTGEQLTGKNSVTSTVIDTKEKQKETVDVAEKTTVSKTVKTDSRVFRPPDWLWTVLALAALWACFIYRKQIKCFFSHFILILKRFFI
jgi:hypothetical protein